MNEKKTCCAVLVRLCVQIMTIHHIPLVVNVILSLRSPTPTFPSQEFGGIIFFLPQNFRVVFYFSVEIFHVCCGCFALLLFKNTAGCWKMDVHL